MDDSCQNYEKLSKFVKVMAKILSVPLFSDRVTYNVWLCMLLTLQLRVQRLASLHCCCC